MKSRTLSKAHDLLLLRADGIGVEVQQPQDLNARSPAGFWESAGAQGIPQAQSTRFGVYEEWTLISADQLSFRRIHRQDSSGAI